MQERCQSGARVQDLSERLRYARALLQTGFVLPVDEPARERVKLRMRGWLRELAWLPGLPLPLSSAEAHRYFHGPWRGGFPMHGGWSR